MRVLLRADAGVSRGTGHVMRCLTLAEEFMRRGAQVELLTDGLTVGWLRDAVRSAGIPVRQCETDSLSLDAVRGIAPDWLVVDSYWIDADAITAVNREVPVLAIIDSDDRGIDASLYLDHNLGAEFLDHPRIAPGLLLAGARYALVRDGILRSRRNDPWVLPATSPTIVSFMGGTDPTNANPQVVEALRQVTTEFDLIVVAPSAQHRGIREIGLDLELIAPTPNLPELFGRADVIVSAAGTSAWDICTLGVPSVLVSVVDNQEPAITEVARHGLAFGMRIEDVSTDLAQHIQALLTQEPLRRSLSDACLGLFDGGGKRRVVDIMESGVQIA